MSKKKSTNGTFKWRSKSFAVLVMVLILVLAVLISVIAQQAESKYGLRKDLSFNQITTLSDTTLALLSDLNQPVKIYVVAARGSEDYDLVGLLDRYQSQNSNISWEQVVPTENPALIKAYQEKGETIRENGIIVEAAKTGRYRVIDPGYYAAREYNTDLELELRYQYEKMITEALLYTTADYVPNAKFLTGHGEIIEEADLLAQALSSNGYEVSTYDFEYGETALEGDLLFIMSPTRDFSEKHIERLMAYLNGGGAIFVTLDPSFDENTSLAKMPNFVAFLKAYGIYPTDGIILAAQEEENTYYDSILALAPSLTDVEANALLLENNLNEILLPQARGFYEPEVFDEKLKVENLLISGNNAFERNMTYDNLEWEKQPDDKQGPFGLAVLSARQESSGETGKIFAIGSSLAFTDEDVMYYSTNESFLHTVLSNLVPKESSSLNISTKAGYRPPLSQNSTTMGVAIVIILPVLVLIAAMFILRPRKYL